MRDLPTRPGGRTQAWLAASDDPVAQMTGGYFHHLRPRKPSGAVGDTAHQERLLATCQQLSGVELVEN